MSSKTICTAVLAVALASTAAMVADTPAANANATAPLPVDQGMHWQRSMHVPHDSAAHEQLMLFLKQHVSSPGASFRDAGIKGDFQVSFGHAFDAQSTPRADDYPPPFDPSAKGLYAKGDTFVAAACHDGTRRAWRFVYQPTARDNDHLQWRNNGTNYRLASPNGRCPPASQWLPDETKASPGY